MIDAALVDRRVDALVVPIGKGELVCRRREMFAFPTEPAHGGSVANRRWASNIGLHQTNPDATTTRVPTSPGVCLYGGRAAQLRGRYVLIPL
jgi:hypothetical protein